jgi:hypothetical protein
MHFHTDFFIRPKEIAWDGWKTAVLPSVGTLVRLEKPGGHERVYETDQNGARRVES